MHRAVVPFGLVALLVLLTVGAGLLGWSMSPERPAVTVTSDHTASLVIPDTAYGPRPGWKEVGIEGISLWVPKSWKVLHTLTRDCSDRPFVVLAHLHGGGYSFLRCGDQPASVLVVAFRPFLPRTPGVPDTARYNVETVRNATGDYTTTADLISGTLGITVDVNVRSSSPPAAGGPELVRGIFSSVRIENGTGRTVRQTLPFRALR